MITKEKHSGTVMQHTLKESISYVGRGLHTGHKVAMRLRPGEVNSGICFFRKDVPRGRGMIPARWHNVVTTRLCTVIGNEHGVQIGTIEHLMAALRGCGVDNAIIELDGPEVPIMDGSSEPFVSLIERVGTVSQAAPRRAIWIHRPIAVCEGEKFAVLMPDTTTRITVEINFAPSAVGHHRLSLELVDDVFQIEIARARTFGFADQIQELRKQGLSRGGSLRNAILVDGDHIINEEGLRFRDEFVRHKILDCLGDLALVGAPILGHFYAYKPGHELNNALLRQLFYETDAWSYLGVDEFDNLIGAHGPPTGSEITDAGKARCSNKN